MPLRLQIENLISSNDIALLNLLTFCYFYQQIFSTTVTNDVMKWYVGRILGERARRCCLENDQIRDIMIYSDKEG